MQKAGCVRRRGGVRRKYLTENHLVPPIDPTSRQHPGARCSPMAAPTPSPGSSIAASCGDQFRVPPRAWGYICVGTVTLICAGLVTSSIRSAKMAHQIGSEPWMDVVLKRSRSRRRIRTRKAMKRPLAYLVVAIAIVGSHPGLVYAQGSTGGTIGNDDKSISGTREAPRSAEPAKPEVQAPAKKRTKSPLQASKLHAAPQPSQGFAPMGSGVISNGNCICKDNWRKSAQLNSSQVASAPRTASEHIRAATKDNLASDRFRHLSRH